MTQKRQAGFPSGGRYRAALLALGLFALSAAPAGAVTITAQFLSSKFPSFTTPSSAKGGGNLTDIFDTAIDYWEKAIPSSGSVRILTGWGTLGPNVLASTFTFSHKSSYYHYPPNYVNIEFNNSNSANWSWFLDPTPTGNSEYSTFTSSSADLGGGIVNTGRVFTGANGAAAGNYDLLSVALHEIGHALGFTPSSGTNVVVAGPLPDVGTSIRTTTGGHIDIETAELYYSLPPSERKLLTGVDILGVAQLAGYRTVDLNPVPVPLPGGLVLMVSGIVALGVRAAAGRRRAA
ncbi:hypothetical protein BMS3Bbin12_00364 [bacterium BMS3Bbin12]|nr:hypothetical protein BMS3Bbin12_00364 [bacterium BMS3Bbin12]GBE49624.1 hypothetical protein BMS3Bbin13_00544 [bacterium BMS3Bbin13]